jgi:cold shock CspA family protein
MPTGIVTWYDPKRGEGRITAKGREYPVRGADMQAGARTTGARVRFDVARSGGVRRATRVHQRSGTRSVARHRRFGDLTGAERPAHKGRPASARRYRDTEPPARGPAPLVRRWVTAANGCRLDRLLPLYAPDAVLHVQGDVWRGRTRIRHGLLDSGLLSRGWQTSADSATVAVRSRLAEQPGLHSRFRVLHGQIVEQWIEAPATRQG